MTMEHLWKLYDVTTITGHRRIVWLSAAALAIVVIVIIQITVVQILIPDAVSTRRIPRRYQNIRRADTTASGTTPSTVIRAVETKDIDTNAARSSWFVLSQNNSVGRPLNVIVTARDRKGKERKVGGDFFTAVLTSVGANSLRATVCGEVKDLFDGSYLITFVPYWSGPATIHITLWVTSGVVELLKNTITPNYVFLCTFGDNYGIQVDYIGLPLRNTILPELGDALRAKQDGVGLCHMDWQPLPPRSKTSCSMPFPNKHHWYGVCDAPPARNSTTCDSLQWCVHDDTMAIINMHERALATENIGIVPGDVTSVTIISKTEDDVKETLSKEPCRPQPYVKASGYWLGGDWMNRDCSFDCNSQDKWWQCLTGRDMYFIGDSTIRQLFVLLLSSAGVEVPPRGQQFIPSDLANAFVEEYDATIRYRMHGPPVLMLLTVNFSSATFSADIIDAIPANGHEILVMSIIHHFILLSPEGFQLRLQQIIAAIRRLRERNMGRKIPIVFRTANPRGFDSFHVNVYRVRWYNEMAVDAFVASRLGVIVYDIFDMIASGPRPGAVHQTVDVMSVQLSHILSLICYD